MNLKHTVFVLLFFIFFSMCFTGCGTFFWSKESSVKIIAPSPIKNNKPESGTQDEQATATATAVAAATAAATAATITTTATTGAATSTATTTATGTTATTTTTTQLQQSSPPPAGARFIPITWDIVNGMNNSGVNLTDLRYYLSNPFAMTIAVQKDTPIKMEANEGSLVISGGQDITTREVEFTIADQGTLRNIEAASETLVIVFKDTPLIFKKNSQGRYDLSSYEIEAGTYNFRYEDGLPQLCILAQLNNRHEVLASIDLTPGGSQRNAGSVQQTAHRDIEQSNQNININYSPNIPSTQIMGPGSVTERGVIEYVICKTPSVDRARLSSLVDTYIREAEAEGVNHDIAIAQMLYATNNLGNQRMTTHNYGGLSTNGLRWDGSFCDMATGVQAHIQHLKGYASTLLPNKQPVVDPRYQILVDLRLRGTVGTFDDLYRRWAANYANYRNGINRILNDLYSFSANYR
jgi:hypothetical protein